MATKEKIEQRIKQLQAELQKKNALEKEKERKARTKRLIELGAVVESVLGVPITQEKLPLLKKFLEEQEARGQFFSKALGLEKELAEMKKAEEKTENNIAKVASEVKNFVDEGSNEL